MLVGEEEGTAIGFVEIYNAPADRAYVFDLARYVPNDEPRHAHLIAEDIK
jgi:hypothetical protein